MKLKLTFLPEEEQQASAVLLAVRRFFPGSKVRDAKAPPPKKSVYLSTKRKGNAE